jgi:hypothetical protein
VTGGYLRQLELTKQLEQQAKKAAKNREAAESKLSEAEELIGSAKSMEAKVVEAERLLVEASDSFSRKDYKGALSLATRSMEVALGAKRDRMEEVLSSTRQLLEQMGDLATNASEPNAAIETAAGLMESDLDRAYAEANSAWDRTEQYINSRMADEFERAQSLLLMAEEQGVDTGGEREQLGRARRSLESGEFLESLGDLRGCLDSVSRELDDLYRRRRKELENGMGNLGEMDIDLQRVEEHLKRVEEHLEQGKMDEVFSDLTIAEGEFRKSLSRGMTSSLDSLLERVRFLSRYGENVPGMESSISETRELIERGEHWDAMDNLHNIARDLGDRKLEVLLDQMYRLKPKLQIAKRTGNDVTKALMILEDSRQTMRQGDFQGAVDLVHQADAVLEEELKGFREVESELARTEELMTYAERYGVDQEGAKESMKVARGLAIRGNLAESLDQLRSAQRELDRGIQGHIGSEIMRIELLLASAMRMGTDMSQESAMVDDVMERVRKGDYRNVEETLEECRLKMGDFLEDNAETALERARKLLDMYEGMAEISSSRAILEEASSAYGSGDFDRAFRLARKAVDDLQGQETEIMDSGFREARRLVEINRELGSESATINERLGSAETLRLEGSTRDALEAVQEVLQLAGPVVRETIWKGLESLSRSITSAHKKGVEVLKIEKLAESVSRSLEQESLASAYDTLCEAEEELRTTLDRHSEITEMVQEIDGLLEEARSNGIDATGAE